jgi:hypothetical protein
MLILTKVPNLGSTPRFRSSSFGGIAFISAAPGLWNSFDIWPGPGFSLGCGILLALAYAQDTRNHGLLSHSMDVKSHG